MARRTHQGLCGDDSESRWWLASRRSRPVTVLDVVYRVWAKGVVMAWVPVLHREYLTGPHRNGFPGPVRYVALGATSAGPDLAAETSGATIVAFVF